MTARKNLLGQLLLDAKIITPEQLEEAVRVQTETGERLGSVLVALGYAREEDVLRALENQLDVPFVQLAELEIDPEVTSAVPANFVHRYHLIPVRKDGDSITVAVSDPLDLDALDELRLLLGCDVRTVVASKRDIDKAINRYYGIGADTVERIIQEEGPLSLEMEEVEEADLESMATDASIVRFVNQVILEAVNSRATDIHFEPLEDELRIRYRIDGVLYPANTPASLKRFQAAITSRVKIMAGLDIAEKRRPQDGRIKARLAGEDIDMRVSTIPTMYGESVNIRLLPKRALRLEELGLPEDLYPKFENLIHKPHGIVLVTGPTGCGKTTTLHAALSKINSIEKKIITIEDPIEYELPGVSQIEVMPKIDLTFATGLRSILRQDPDVIMVGEIRDPETAEIAIRAAMTGHLVFSTLHTNDAAGAVARLVDMGVEPYLIASSLEGVVAQRLVRLVCPHCRRPVEPDVSYLAALGFRWPPGRTEPLWKGEGCEECKGTGYLHRTAVFEMLIVTDAIRELIVDKAPAGEIKAAAVAAGMTTLREAGWRKVLAGETTVEEVLRATEAEEAG